MPMYNLIEYNSTYSETTRTFWFYTEYESFDFNNSISNTDNFKSFKYKTKLFGNTKAQADNAANGILKNVTIAVPSKYLSRFWRSLEMILINCKVELKLRWSKHCVLSVAGTDNANSDNDDNNIIFTIKDTKLYVPVVTLSENYQNFLSKDLKDQFIGMSMK